MQSRTRSKRLLRNCDADREFTVSSGRPAARHHTVADRERSIDRSDDSIDGTTTPPARKILKSLLSQEVQKALHYLEDEVSTSTFSQVKNHRAASLIPDFDPENEEYTIQTWLKKIDQLGEIHGWDDSTKSFYLQDKLRGQARTWYNRLDEYDKTWTEWKELLLRTFPKHRDYASLLEELLNRKKKPTESMTKYYQDKCAMCYRCKLSNAAAVSCIIRGLPAALQSNARAFQCERPEQLYESYLSALDDYRPTDSGPRTLMQYKDSPRQLSSTEKKAPIDIEKDPCPRCKKTGHLVRNCPLPDQRTCFKCGSQGHIAPRCPENQKVKEVKIIQNYNSTYIKTAKCNDVYVRSYVDTGSEVNILNAKVAELLDLNIKPSYVALKGFNGNSVNSKGEVEFNLKIDELDLQCTAQLTDVEMKGINLLIGQPIINKEGVSLIVQGGTATLKKFDDIDIMTCMEVAEDSHRFKVMTTTKECLPPGTSIIKVDIVGNCDDNNVVTPTRHFDLQGVSYSLPATLLRGSEGYLKVINTGDKDVEWSQGTVLLRAESCEEASAEQEQLLQDGRV